jgi:hypothetical protein
VTLPDDHVDVTADFMGGADALPTLDVDKGMCVKWSKCARASFRFVYLGFINIDWNEEVTTQGAEPWPIVNRLRPLSASRFPRRPPATPWRSRILSSCSVILLFLQLVELRVERWNFELLTLDSLPGMPFYGSLCGAKLAGLMGGSVDRYIAGEPEMDGLDYKVQH